MGGRGSRRSLVVGDLIRLKVRTIGGWKGVGVVCEDVMKDGTVAFIRADGPTWMDGDWFVAPSMACPHEVAVVRNQGSAAEMAERISWCRFLVDRSNKT